MSKFFDFFIGGFSSLGFINTIYDYNYISSNILDSFIKISIAVIGGVLAALILNILKAQFPSLFKPIWKSDKRNSSD